MLPAAVIKLLDLDLDLVAGLDVDVAVVVAQFFCGYHPTRLEAARQAIPSCRHTTQPTLPRPCRCGCPGSSPSEPMIAAKLSDEPSWAAVETVFCMLVKSPREVQVASRYRRGPFSTVAGGSRPSVLITFASSAELDRARCVFHCPELLAP